MADITGYLIALRHGDRKALQSVFELVYPELKRIAAVRLMAAGEAPTLSSTVLVHEAYLRLIGSYPLELEDRRHFFACAARAMRLVIIDHARQSSAQKRGGNAVRITWSEDLPIDEDTGSSILDLTRVLNDLGEINSRAREVIDFRFFAGLTASETAELMQLSRRTVDREWKKARAYIYANLTP